VIAVASASALNFLALSVYSLGVQVANYGAGSSLSSSAVATVSLTEVNKPPYFPTPTMAMSVAENSAAGASVGTIVGADPNTHTSPSVRTDALTYAITTAGVPFVINATSGAITVASGARLDYETQPSYTLGVSVQDAGWAGSAATSTRYTAAGTVVVSLVNANDRPTIADQAGSVAENAAGAAVAVVAAADQDIVSAGQTLGFALSRTDHVCWAFSSGSASLAAAQFVPLSLSVAAPAAGSTQTVFARVQGLAAGQTATLILSNSTLTQAGAGSAAADRYEVRFTTAGTQILRCSGGATCAAASPALLANSATSFVSSFSPSTAAPISSVRVVVACTSSTACGVTVYGSAVGGAAGAASTSPR